MTDDSQDIETATTALESPQMSGQPDAKTRRYDRQLRLWAASGQTALESARILVISASATSTSILKNLVLPGIGHFTFLDPGSVSQEDAGNNFFLEGPESIGKSRAKEAVRLLRELNDSVEGEADTSHLASRLTDVSYLSSFNLIIAHNLSESLLLPLTKLLWSDPTTLPPLITVRSAGFLADFHIQIHEHTIVDSHPEGAPSLRLDKPFPALLEYARSLELETMDGTEHAHIPYAVILVRALDDWKVSHGGEVPKTSADRAAFKKSVLAMKRKPDEENFDEAATQTYRAYTETKVPYDIAQLFEDPLLKTLSPTSPPFFHLLAALKTFTEQPPYTLPLSSALPDMKSDTKSYVHLQTLYKRQAEEEKARFREILRERGGVEVDEAMVDEFVRNAHGLKIVRGHRWGTVDENPQLLANLLSSEETALPAATHLALSAASHLLSKNPHNSGELTAEQLTVYIQSMLPAGTVLPKEVASAVGEIARTPTADLPNTAAFLGGLVAQEAIKVITKQYVPVQGTCVVDLVASRTGVLNV
ncbi:uncharacterized protein FOMMEDRAFT_131246 [Fomitiporia mediterranea MF3/22]|uniref:uncharacterized protein n=1 Tax=Fomitiporia mediterranea (strain MF3/22) TaxID=694068 RepID=UPI000440812E|nr:uncharacterized protein FOMMEDRAFT_131246 [Fomitiporia mediterranea MF3/22]EJD08513.1 hypothetical protein FOMMEDRAFT_131246 [Fomitiporia mediterranea MF3/22]